MRRYRAAVILLAIATVAQVQADDFLRQIGWPSGSVKHNFHSTPTGQLHYVTSGDVSQKGTLLYMHAHPRSASEFKYVHAALNGSVPFIGVDLYGFGQSEDYKGQNDTDEWFSFETIASRMLEIAAREGVRDFTATGFLKGCNVAIELAYQGSRSQKSGDHPRCTNLVLMGPVILSPATAEKIRTNLVPMERNQNISKWGLHVAMDWLDNSATSANFNKPRDLVNNQDKTIDELRAQFTKWKYQAAWADYTAEKQIARMAAIDTVMPSLFLYPSAAFKAFAANLDTEYSLNAFALALTHHNNETHWMDGATQGMLEQNDVEVAHYIKDFVHQKGLAHVLV